MNKKVGTLTLGCKVNSYDTEAMMKIFSDKGYEEVSFEDMADVYLINTCSVTNLSDKKSRQMIRRAVKKNPNAIVVATGCYAQTSPDEVLDIQGVNIVIGTKDRTKIVDIIESYNKKQGKKSYVGDIMKERIFEPLNVNEIKSKTRAYLKIQEGCNQFCTYCIIPYARGPIRSREPKEVIEEVKRLAENGFKEVVLAGIHIASYGKDTNNTTLIDIIKEVHKIDGIKRIRFSSIEPNFINDNVLEELVKLPKVCDFFHLSLQSGSDKVLKDMKRKYTTKEYRQAVEKIRKFYKEASITTDVIVGFPDESDLEFEETITFIKSIKLSKIHVFPYSPKKGTKAYEMKNQISSHVKNQRSEILRKVSDELEVEFIEKINGKTVSVLFENKSKNNMYEGHTTNYIKVFKESKDDISNKILDVKILSVCDGIVTSE